MRLLSHEQVNELSVSARESNAGATPKLIVFRPQSETATASVGPTLKLKAICAGASLSATVRRKPHAGLNG